MNTQKLEAALRDLRNLVKLPGEESIADEELVRRYAVEREEAAFAALVRRYGPMVLRVCCRVLHRSHDAEDAFQSTFLILAREAASLRRYSAVGAWIHDVAYHTALRMREQMARQRRHEEQHVPATISDGPEDGILRDDVQAALYEELHRLPEKLRIPLVMCNLMGRTQDEVARELGLHRTSVVKRLRRAYSLLRQRLLSRGIALSLIILSSLLHEEGKARTLPAELLLRTVRSALGTASRSVPALAAAATAGGTSGYLIGVLKTKQALLVAVLLLSVGSYWAERAWNVSKPEHGEASAALPPAPTPHRANHILPHVGECIPLSGTVVDANGRPVPHAQVAVCGLRAFRHGKRNVRDETLVRGWADDNGHFQIHVSRPDSVWSLRTAFVHLWAAAPGHAPAALRLPWRPDSPPLSVRLGRPETIRGRLMGSDGRPAAHVRIFVSQIGDIHREPIQGDRVGRRLPGLWPSPVTTDSQGRFALPDLNLDLDLGLYVCDERYALRRLVLNPARWRCEERTLRLAPARLLEGRVVTVTGAPLPAAHLRVLVYDAARRLLGSALDARADAAGVFRIQLPVGDSYRVEAVAAHGAPYVGIAQEVSWPDEATHQQLELHLPRGILLRGIVRDADSGLPIPEAFLQFRPLDDNTVATAPTLPSSILGESKVEAEILTGLNNPTRSGADGSFRLVVPRTKGLLFVHEPSGDYVREEWIGRIRGGCDRAYANRVLVVNATSGPKVQELGVELRRGVRIEGRILRPDGEPDNDGAWICRDRTCPNKPGEAQPQPYWNGRFVVRGCVAGRVYSVLFLDARRRLGAKVELLAVEDGKPVEVRLQPCGEAEVRFVDACGQPVAGYQPFLYVMVPSDRAEDEPTSSSSLRTAARASTQQRTEEMHELDEFDPDHYRDGPRTDAEGRVTLPALIPGVYYRMSHYQDASGAWCEFAVEPGQKLSLPDVRLNRAR